MILGRPLVPAPGGARDGFGEVLWLPGSLLGSPRAAWGSPRDAWVSPRRTWENPGRPGAPPQLARALNVNGFGLAFRFVFESFRFRFRIALLHCASLRFTRAFARHESESDSHTPTVSADLVCTGESMYKGVC